MAVNPSMQQFLDSPDTVGFVVRGTDDLDRLIEENPDIIATQTLAGRYVVCYTTVEAYPRLLTTLGTGYISSIAVILGPLCGPGLKEAGICSIRQQPYMSLHGEGVLMGFVDTGIDYTQSVFRREDGSSKIHFLYDQSITGIPPKGFFIGTEYTNEQINQALKSENPYEIVPSRDTAGHGTFLASVAAGQHQENFTGVAPESELIVVKLKKARPFGLELFAVPEEQENAFSSIAVMIGVEYIVQKAHELKRPVVICLGIGTNFASHDGFSIFEEYLSGIAALAGVCVCSAAGNESQARGHTKGIVTSKGDFRNIDVKVVQPDSNFFVSVWSAFSDKLSVSVTSPTGEYVPRKPPKDGVVLTSNAVMERSQVRVASYYPLEGSGGQLTSVRVLNATPGVWTIAMHGDIILDGTFNAWLPITGFVTPGVEFLDADPYYTITVPSTAMGAIGCGAYNSMNGTLYPNSSWGPTRHEQVTPDLTAPGVNIEGFYPTGRGVMSGTSPAAAITAGACALLMQWGVVEGNEPTMSTCPIRAYLIRGCDRTQTQSYPNPQWGYGTLNLLQSFQLMREM